MKNVKKIIAVLLFLFSGCTSAAAIVSWSTSTTDVNVNDVFTLNVIGSGFVSNVDGGGVNFSFDQSVFKVLSVGIDESVWDFGGFGISTGNIDNFAGTVDGIMVNTFANVSGSFTVATIEIQAIAAGNGLLGLSEYVLNPWASAGSLINPDYVDGTVSVTAIAEVPLPAAVWLFSAGLLGLLGVAKRRLHAC